MSCPAIELRDVFCVHRTPEGDAAALQGLCLDVERGEQLSVLGPSGAGKTTLLRVLAGLHEPSAGIVRVFGDDVGRLPARARAAFRHARIGFLDERADRALAADLCAAGAVALPMLLRGVGRAERAARVDELLDAAGLRDRAGALPGQLSGGERQRVALCAALAHRPELLLADEPTGELDDLAAASVRDLIAALATAEGTTVITVTHDPLASARAQHTVRIRDGRIVEDGRDGHTALVVGAGGWVRIPPGLLASVGIIDRARIEPVDGGLMVTRAPGEMQRRRVEALAHVPSRDRGTPAGAGGGAGRDAGAGGEGRGLDASARGDAGAGASRDVDTRPSWRPAQVELRSVSRSRGSGATRRLVIDGLTRVVAPGRMTVVTGRSGSGKTTLLRLLAGLDRADGGDVSIDGRPLGPCNSEQRAALRRERIGFMAQEPSPVAFLSAEENVMLTLSLRGWETARAKERAATVLGWLGLTDRAGQRVARLSAGETQRVALARALAGARGLLIVDEPTSRLDEANASVVGELLARAAAEDAQTVICATHDPTVISAADEVLELSGSPQGQHTLT